MSEMISQMGMALGFVLLLIAATGFIYRKRQKVSGLISVVSYQSLGQKVGIAAVKVGSEVLVVGVTPSDFKLLKRFDASLLGQENVTKLPERLERLRKMKEGIRG